MSDFFSGFLQNASNDILQNELRYYIGHAPVSRLDNFYIEAFKKFLPSPEELEGMDKDQKKKIREKRLNMAYSWAHEFEHKIITAKPAGENIKNPHDHNHNLE